MRDLSKGRGGPAETQREILLALLLTIRFLHMGPAFSRNLDKLQVIYRSKMQKKTIFASKMQESVIYPDAPHCSEFHSGLS